MRSTECLVGVCVLAIISCCLAASITKGGDRNIDSKNRVKRHIGGGHTGSWNVIRPWETRYPCEMRPCWTHDDCCRGFACFGVDDDWMNMQQSECRRI